MSERLYSPAVIRAVMERHHLRFTKAWGQNFLIDGNLVHKIIETAEVQPGDVVLEVGPGIGTLTQALLEAGAIVVSVELDRTFFPVLRATFGQNERFHLLEGDALKLDLGDALSHIAPVGTPVKVVANVPYYITTPLLRRFLDDTLPVDTVTVLVQKEVAERMTATPGNKVYGALTLMIALYGQAQAAFIVPRTAFLPPPKVDSAVVHIKKQWPDNVSPEACAAINLLVRDAFLQRRKMVVKALSKSTGASLQALRNALIARGLPATARAENLSITDFIAIYKEFGYKKQEDSGADRPRES